MKQYTSLQDYIFVSKYARTVNGRKESWPEAVDRVMNMHRDYLAIRHGVDMYKMEPYLQLAEEAYKEQLTLGAQRALQWGGSQLLKHHFRLYNCAASYANRVDFFSELMYVLLCGAGVGYSVQKQHVDMMPKVKGPGEGSEVFVVPDSIEGWADAVKMLAHSYFYKKKSVSFDFSKIRPKGAPISGGFKAPGPEPLATALNKVKTIFKAAIGRKLKPIEAHEISCILADAVISGGVRRSALLSIFSVDDEEMMNCKTGDWWTRKEYLGRANNSAAVLPNTSFEQYKQLFSAIRQFGEPGIVFLVHPDQLLNPCAEISMYPVWVNEDGTKEYGFSVCNLTEINGSKVVDKSAFKKAVVAGAILGTIQAAYADFPYLGSVTEKIIRRDALIGVGITGMCENPDILFNPGFQTQLANWVKSVNKDVAEIIGINYAARTTTIKPSGTTSSLLGTSSGIHPFHAKRYIRHVQANKQEQSYQAFLEVNPNSVEDSLGNTNDGILAFPIEKNEDVICKKDLTAIEFLEKVKLTQNNWILSGTNWEHPSYQISPEMTHNVSNTCTVKPDEWNQVMGYLWDNREFFCGVSFLPSSGDLDYPQAPFSEVIDEVELAERYGAAAILAGGLNVDGIHAFGNLWIAINTALGRGESLVFNTERLAEIITKAVDPSSMTFLYKVDGVMVSDVNAIIANIQDKLKKKEDWIRRFRKFADKYLDGDLEKTGHCLKQVSLLHKWNQIKDQKQVNWKSIEWEDVSKDAGSETAVACSGGACEIIQ